MIDLLFNYFTNCERTNSISWYTQQERINQASFAGKLLHALFNCSFNLYNPVAIICLLYIFSSPTKIVINELNCLFKWLDVEPWVLSLGFVWFLDFSEGKERKTRRKTFSFVWLVGVTTRKTRKK